MKMKKEIQKILKATNEVVKEKERQKLYEAAHPHFKSEWDALCFELEHPSPEFIAAGKRINNALKNIDYSKVKVVNIKL